MTDADEVNAAIVTTAGRARRIKDGEQEIEQASLTDLVAAAKHLANAESVTAAAAQPHFGLRFTKLVPPGAG